MDPEDDLEGFSSSKVASDAGDDSGASSKYSSKVDASASKMSSQPDSSMQDFDPEGGVPDPDFPAAAAEGTVSFRIGRSINPPGSYGGKTADVAHAESPHSKVSKRYEPIMDVATKLESDQTFLRAQAIAKNRAFQKRIEALHERIQRWKIKVAEETEAREREDAEIRVRLSTKLAQLDDMFMTRLEAEHRKIEDVEVPAVHQRYDAWYEEFREFVDITVPDVIERQQGTVTRHLKKARETFEIDNTKLLQREQEIRDLFAAHVIDAASMQEQETTTRSRAHVLLEEAVNERTRLWDRCEEDFYAPYMTQITEMKAAMEEEVITREENDMVVLETMKESMDRLQQVVLRNFGAEGRRK